MSEDVNGSYDWKVFYPSPVRETHCGHNRDRHQSLLKGRDGQWRSLEVYVVYSGWGGGRLLQEGSRNLNREKELKAQVRS